MILNIKRLHPNAQLPTKARPGDAAFNLYAVEDGAIDPLSTKSIPLGIATEFPDSLVAIIKDRSSLGKKGMHTFAGVIDSSYRGEWSVILYNATGSTFSYKAGDRIAQVLFLPVPAIEVHEVAQITASVRGDGGFGSTGK